MRKKRVDQIPWQGFYWSAWVRWVPLSREKCFTGKFRLSSLALKLFSNGCGMLLPWMAIWIHRFSSCKGTSVHCHFYSIWSGKYLYLIVFFPPQLILAFKTVCSFQVLHLLAPHSFDTTWLSKVTPLLISFLPSFWGFVCLSNFATRFLLSLSIAPEQSAPKTLHTLCSTWLALHGIPSS